MDKATEAILILSDEKMICAKQVCELKIRELNFHTEVDTNHIQYRNMSFSSLNRNFEIDISGLIVSFDSENFKLNTSGKHMLVEVVDDEIEF